MFEGEFEGLKHIMSTGTIKCPEPYHIFEVNGSWNIAMEYLNLSYLSSKQSGIACLPESLFTLNIVLRQF